MIQDVLFFGKKKRRMKEFSRVSTRTICGHLLLLFACCGVKRRTKRKIKLRGTDFVGQKRLRLLFETWSWILGKQSLDLSSLKRDAEKANNRLFFES
jgi:hypothetical protein